MLQQIVIGILSAKTYKLQIGNIIKLILNRQASIDQSTTFVYVLVSFSVTRLISYVYIETRRRSNVPSIFSKRQIKTIY